MLLAAIVVTPVAAADPVREAAAQLAAEHGGSAGDYTLVYERTGVVPGTAEAIWIGKFVSARSGALHAVERASDGVMSSGGLLAARAEAAASTLTALEQKASPELLARLSEAAQGATATSARLAITVWLEVDQAALAAAVAAVTARHPEVPWIGDRPVSDDMAVLRAVRGELYEARAQVYASAAARLASTAAALDGVVAYASTSAPVAFVDMPAATVEALAAEPQVSTLGQEGRWAETMTSAGPTVRADWTGGSGDQGDGVRIAVVEYLNVRNSGDLAGQVVASYSTTGTLSYSGAGQFDHPSWVAGAIASLGGYRGVAPGADIVSASTGGNRPGVQQDRDVVQAADWAIAPGGGDADIVNTSLVQDTATGADEARRYFDSIGWEHGRLPVSAAGNFSALGTWDVGSPGTGYNVLTVGGTDDRQTANLADDLIWYSSDGSSYRDPTSAPWNPHGDFNKPNLSAPAVGVRTANGMTGTGTSAATPIVAGIAAQLLARAPSLATWPEATRAILMAGAAHHAPLPGGGRNADHEGVGIASALWSNRILSTGDGILGGYRLGTMTSSATVSENIAVTHGQPVRVALAWSSHTSGANLTKSDQLTADLDLRVVHPDGSTSGSFSIDNSYEWVEFTARGSGTMRIEIHAPRFQGGSEPYGLAWLKQTPFSDVADTSMFYTDIEWLRIQEITLGCDGSRFCPGDAVTREQMASFLSRARDLPPASRDYFTDDAGSGHQDDINRIAEAGITLGCGGTSFCPTSTVTREQMASFLRRALNLGPASRDFFTDDAGSIHEDDINRVAQASITLGCGGTFFCPRESVTREQMAAFLHRALGP